MSGPLTVCIVTPGHLSTNPRVVKEATALSDAGHRVTIVCGSYLPTAIAMDRDIAHPSWTVRPVAFGRQVAHHRVHARQRALQSAARIVARAGSNAPDVTMAAHAPVAADLATAARAVPADLYIAHYVAALPAAAKAAKLHGARYAFDAEDFHLGDLPDRPEHAFEKRLIHAIESRWLPGAAYVTAAAPLIASAYVETYGITRPTVVLNTFPRSCALSAPTPAGTARPGPSVYWFSQTIGRGRGLGTALDAIALAQAKPHLYLRGTPAAGYRDRLMDQASRLGVADRLHFLAPAPPSELERAGAVYDLGYVGETGFSRNNQKALANKLFSYLTSGLPIVASDTLAHRDVAPQLADVMSVHPVHDAAHLARGFDALLLNQDRLAISRKRAWSLGQNEFSWESQASIVVRSLAGSIDER